jgi:hypothetical protein
MKYARFTHPLTVSFEPQTYNQIKQISEQRHISMADVLRQMAERYLAAPQSDSTNNNQTF